MMERFNTFPVVCEGGLDSNQNYLLLSQRSPGVATRLINHEPSLYGGYRRIDGFQPLNVDYPEVDEGTSEGKILGLAIYNDNIIAMRKLVGNTTYSFFQYDEGGPWIEYVTGLTHTVTNVDKIRHVTFNFDGTEKIVFVDGVNYPLSYDGTNWNYLGGDSSLETPKYITLFKNHIFVAGDSLNPNVVAHSAPNDESDWTAASGAGQVIAGFAVKQIKTFRDELYVFGETDIKKIVLEGTDFVLKDVTFNIGCLAPDSIIEVNGDLMFLSQDGFRTIAATERIGDIELGVLSKNIQQDVTELIESSDLSQVNGVVLRKKSQVRFFFSDENLSPDANTGIIAGLRGSGDSTFWEWGNLQGIRASCVISSYVGVDEYILHGDYDGVVYKQEEGNSFNGENILAVYQMPYLDFGDIYVRKTIHKVTVFLRPEGNVTISAALQFNWNDENILNPVNYVLEDQIEGVVYGSITYNSGATYSGTAAPILASNVEGSGFSTRFTFVTNDIADSYSIQAVVFEYSVNGRK